VGSPQFTAVIFIAGHPDQADLFAKGTDPDEGPVQFLPTAAPNRRHRCPPYATGILARNAWALRLLRPASLDERLSLRMTVLKLNRPWAANSTLTRRTDFE
jgi:hypothetical protein